MVTNSTNGDRSLIDNYSAAYSAIAAANVLSLSAEAFTIMAKTHSPQSREVRVVNLSPYPVTIGTIALFTPVTGLTFNANPTTGIRCSDNLLLASNGASCSIKIDYNPSAEQAELVSRLLIPITHIGGSALATPSNREVSLRVSAANIIAPANITVAPAPLGALASGVSKVSDTAYNILALAGTSLKLKYTFTADISGGAASNFNVGAQSLPVGAQIIPEGTTCATGTNIQTLNPGNSCEVVVLTPSKDLVENKLLTATPFNIVLTYSWQDVTSASALQLNKSYTTGITITPSLDWIFGLSIESYSGYPDSTRRPLFIVNFESISQMATNIDYPITVTAKLPGSVESAECNINSPSDKSCKVTTPQLPEITPTSYYTYDLTIQDLAT